MRQTVYYLGIDYVSIGACVCRYVCKDISPTGQSQLSILDQSLNDPRPSSIALCHCARSQANVKFSIALSSSIILLIKILF